MKKQKAIIKTTSVIITTFMLISVFALFGALNVSAASSTKGGLTVTGGTEGVDYEWGDPINTTTGSPAKISVQDQFKVHLIIKTSTPLTVSGTGTAPGYDENGGWYGQMMYVPENVEANVTFNNVKLKGCVLFNSPVYVYDGGTLNLTLKGSNTLSLSYIGLNGYGSKPLPAIYVPSGAKLVVTAESTGSLTASVDDGPAVIGGSGGAEAQNLIAGKIYINGGTFNLTSTGSDSNLRYRSGAAIGAGNGGQLEYIEINGGTIYANSQHGAAIGTGYNYNYYTLNMGGKIVVNGGVIHATSADTADAIGTGKNYVASKPGDVTLGGGIIFDNSQGSIYGTEYTLTDDLTVPAGATLTLNEGQTLNVPSGKTLTINGTLQNNGTLQGSGAVVTAPVITLTSPSPSIMPGMSITMKASVKDAYNDSATGLPDQFNVIYKIGSSGSPVTTSGLTFALPTSGVNIGDTVYVTVQSAEVAGKYTVGTSNTIELAVGQVDYTEEINNLNTAVEDLKELTANKADAADVTEKLDELLGKIEVLEAAKNNYIAADTELENALTEAIAKAKQEATDAANTALTNAKEELTAAIEKKADSTELEKAKEDLNKAIELAKTFATDADAELKNQLDADIEEANKLIASLDQRVTDAVNAINGSIEDLTDAMNKGDKDLSDKIEKLAEDIGVAVEELKQADENNKAELVAKIESAEATLNSAISTVKKNLANAKTELRKAIEDGDTALDGKISNLNDALASAKAALEAADAANKAELTEKIEDAYETLDAAINAVQKDLDQAKAALEAKTNELEAKDEELQTFIIIVSVVSGVALCGSGAFVIWFFVDRKKRI